MIDVNVFQVVTDKRFGIFPLTCLSFLRCLEAALPCALRSFAAFISLGAVVHSCLMWVGSNMGCSAKSGLFNQDALSTGTDSSSDWNAEKSGAELFHNSQRSKMLPYQRLNSP